MGVMQIKKNQHPESERDLKLMLISHKLFMTLDKTCIVGPI